jgi:hypothetical protein
MPGRSKGIHPLGVPIVATLARAGELLRVDPSQLADAVSRARLPAWGFHQDGSPVWKWGQLVRLGQQLGGQLPPSLAHHWRQYEAADRGRANRYGKTSKQPGPSRVGEV